MLDGGSRSHFNATLVLFALPEHLQQLGLSLLLGSCALPRVKHIELPCVRSVFDE